MVTDRMIFNFSDNEGMFCDEQCTAAGCWGKGPEQCLECKNFHYEGKCLDSCKSLPK